MFFWILAKILCLCYTMLWGMAGGAGMPPLQLAVNGSWQTSGQKIGTFMFSCRVWKVVP